MLIVLWPIAGMAVQQIKVLFVLPLLKGNISALLIASEAEQDVNRVFFHRQIRNIQMHDFSINIGLWGLGLGTKSAYFDGLFLQQIKKIRKQDFHETQILT